MSLSRLLASVDFKRQNFFCSLFIFSITTTTENCFIVQVSNLFWTLGVFLAKTLQDNRLVDLPLSTPFLKLLCQVTTTILSAIPSFLYV